MRITGIDHINLRTHDLDRLCRFYTGVLGLERGARPPFANPGAWLYAGQHPLVHVSVVDEAPADDTGAVDHYALAVEGLVEIRRRLEEAGIEYRLTDVPDRAMKQIFVRDPDGVSVELNFSRPDDLNAGG